MEQEQAEQRRGTHSWIAWFIGILAAGGVLTAVVNFWLPRLWPNNPPQARIEVIESSHSVLMNKEIVFDGSKSEDPQGKPLEYRWQIDSSDQEVVSGGRTFRWTFENAQDYVVRLTVKDAEGLQDSTSIIIKVRDEEKTSLPPKPVIPELRTKVFSRTGGSAQHPRAEISVPNGYKIIGGGAKVNWSGAGNLLTSTYPESKSKWVATSKDHDHASPATITVYAIAIHDPSNEWEVRVFTATSSPAQKPRISVNVPNNFIMTGGGARVHWTGAGNLLTASFPRNRHTWVARAKDHTHVSPAALTAYAIGIRPRNGAPLPEGHIFASISSVTAHPSHQVEVDNEYLLTGGGALDNWDGYGNLLTATYPIEGRAWGGAGKDHSVSDPAALTVYAIGVKR